MILEQVVSDLKARWRVVALVTGTAIAAVLLVSLALPPRYEASAAVAVEMSGTDPVGGHAVFKPAGAVSTHGGKNGLVRCVWSIPSVESVDFGPSRVTATRTRSGK